MKNITLLSVLLASIGIAHAVPTAINYQGRLTDGDGNPASGSKLFSLSLYDSATAGNELYTETIGSIAVDDNGIYNFQFGANGTSTVAADEVIATTDGSSQVFNATLSELPVDGSVSIADGIYTWSQAGGSSAPSEFTGSVTVATGAISAIYLSGAPSSGTDITASYDYSESGVSGALRTGSAHWIELSVDGDTQSPRERVLSVPFAQFAAGVLPSPGVQTEYIGHLFESTGIGFTLIPHGYRGGIRQLWHPIDFPAGTLIKSITANMEKRRVNDINPYGDASVHFLRRAISNGAGDLLAKADADQVAPKDYTISPNHFMEEGFKYFILVEVGNAGGIGLINRLSFTYEEQ